MVDAIASPGDIVTAGKYIGAGLAAVGTGAAAIGVGLVFGHFLSGALPTRRRRMRSSAAPSSAPRWRKLSGFSPSSSRCCCCSHFIDLNGASCFRRLALHSFFRT